MLSQSEAIAKVQQQFPHRKVTFFLQYHDLYLIQAVDPTDPEEGDFDPYYSVNPQTGEVNEFSVLTDANRVELTELWIAAQDSK